MTTDDQLTRVFDLRGTPPRTRETYTRCIHAFERYFGYPACELGREQVEQFLLHLVRDRHLSASSHNVYAGALKFLYGWVLDRPEVVARVPRRKQPMHLPVLLAPEQIARLFSAVTSLAVRTVLMLAYGAGLRVSEACALRVDDIDSARCCFTSLTPSEAGRDT
jgi:site-specific recombinase XerD